MPVTVKPLDRYHAVYWIILLNGFGLLMPWNMWVTIAPEYYMGYKLIEVNRNGTKYAPSYALNFLSYLVVASNLPNFILNLINLFFTFKGNLEKRIGSSLMVMGLICLITLAFTIIDTSNMTMMFFIITIVTVVIQNSACGIYQNSLYGLIAIFPPQYTNAILLGSNLCGTFVSIINVITLVATNSITSAAFFYFLISLLVILACFGSLFVLLRLDFYKYYMEEANKKMAKKKYFIENNDTNQIGLKINNCEISEYIDSLDNNNIDFLTIDFRMKLRLYSRVFKKIRIQCFNVWFTFVVTLALFPTVVADVKYYSETGEYDFFIPEKLFTPVTAYLFCNCFIFFGSFLANFIQWPKPKWLIVPVIAQVISIPLMLSCNFRPLQRTWGVLIHNTWIYIAISCTMSICCGYFSALGLMYAPKQVEASKSTIAGMIAAFFLIFGVACGTLLTFVIIWFIDCLGPLQPRKF
ncbi:Equilibrative nucleoside transporter [Dirofilaria immitis]